MSTGRVPTFVVTGFLGSGKTTLLRRLLQEAAFSDTAVIVNEFGEIGLDHDLIAFSSERTVVLQGGCICCSIREDLEETLRELFEKSDKGELPPFRRLVIETTGLTDPVPLLFTLSANPLAASRLAIHAVIATVDGMLGLETLRSHRECEKQIAVADHLVITKCDLVDEREMTALEVRVRSMNPWAKIERKNVLVDDPVELFANDRHSPSRTADAAAGWVLGRHEAEGHLHHRHDGQEIQSFCLVYEAEIDWTAFGIWLTMILHRHGKKILRIKGLLNVKDMPGPVVIHSVQHMVHPPVHLDRWPTADRRSRIVFILQGADRTLIERSVRAFNGLSSIAAPAAGGIEYRPAAAGGMVGGRPIRRATAPRWLKG